MHIIVVTAKPAAEPAASRIFCRPAAGGLAKLMAAKPKFFFGRRPAANSAAYRSSSKQTAVGRFALFLVLPGDVPHVTLECSAAPRNHIPE